MKTLKFITKINASKQKVQDTLWNDSTFRQWTSVFTSCSHAVSDWKEGRKIQFIDGKADGIFSIIKNKIPNQQMSFKHLGKLKKAVEEKKTGQVQWRIISCRNQTV